MGPTPSNVIITADDFGFSPAVNEAVVRGFREGLVTHASLLVNMEGFEDACRSIQREGLHDRIGLHFNLTEGAPLTDDMGKATKFCIDGRFAPVQRFSRYSALSHEDRQAVEREVRAQLDRARARGISITHLDSHNDVHIEPTIAALFVAAAKAYGIERVRPSRNCGPRQGAIRWLQHRSYNAWLGRQGLRRVRYFGTVDDMLWLADRGRLGADVAVEVMTHPRLRADGTVVDAPAMQPLAARVSALRPHLDGTSAASVQTATSRSG